MDATGDEDCGAGDAEERRREETCGPSMVEASSIVFDLLCRLFNLVLVVGCDFRFLYCMVFIFLRHTDRGIQSGYM
jgi:hypothetical protein